MSQDHDIPRDDANEFPPELAELAEVVRQLPPHYRQRVEPALAAVLNSTNRRHRILALVQEALGQLRMDMKYLMFDLDATRRERDEYREKLEGTA